MILDARSVRVLPLAWDFFFTIISGSHRVSERLFVFSKKIGNEPRLRQGGRGGGFVLFFGGGHLHWCG